MNRFLRHSLFYQNNIPIAAFGTVSEMAVPFNRMPNNSFAISLPLPGLQGMTNVAISGKGTTINQFKEKVKELDPTVQSIHIKDENGVKLSSKTQLLHLQPGQFRIELDGTVIFTFEDFLRSNTNVRNSEADDSKFQILKQKVISLEHKYITLESLRELCQECGAKNKDIQIWLNTLQRQQVLLPLGSLEKSSTNLLLNPKNDETMSLLLRALDISEKELESISLQLKSKSKDLQQKQSHLLTIRQKLVAEVESIVNRYKWATFTALNAQFGFLWYLVWYSESWDVMEPITYFLGFTAVLGSSFYHSFTKKDATYGNIWGNVFKKRLKRLQEKNNFDESELELIGKQIMKTESALQRIRELKQSP